MRNPGLSGREIASRTGYCHAVINCLPNIIKLTFVIKILWEAPYNWEDGALKSAKKGTVTVRKILNYGGYQIGERQTELFETGCELKVTIPEQLDGQSFNWQ